jgi:hypothetical protein
MGLVIFYRAKCIINSAALALSKNGTLLEQELSE